MNHRERGRGRKGTYIGVLGGGARPWDGVGDEGDAVRRCSDGQWTSRRWQCRPLDRLGFGVGWRLGEPHVMSPWPPLPLIWHCATGAHQPCWVGRPRSGRRSGPESAVGLDSEEINCNSLRSQTSALVTGSRFSKPGYGLQSALGSV
jgi:hypothetical protein